MENHSSTEANQGDSPTRRVALLAVVHPTVLVEVAEALQLDSPPWGAQEVEVVVALGRLLQEECSAAEVAAVVC